MAKKFTSHVVGMSALALLAAAGMANAQNCSNGVNPAQCTPLGNCNGPDVIVGVITGPSNYTSAGGIEAFSLGTTSCNIGNAQLLWIANDNRHPAITQNMYKLKTFADGHTRFEQLGQSWLKHGFFALSDTVCCTGCQGTDGTRLGIHCADPYTSGRNGTQSGLGPKWQVNANTGVFTYPPANPSGGSATSVTRRLQVKVADLEATSATVKYFGSAQYVTQDDCSSGNQNNSESYIGINVTGSGSAWNAALTGTTQRGLPAIRAWGANAAGVTTTNMQVPGEGLFIVAASVTALPGGMWHYEYAVQNLNSDRSGRAFSVPVPAGVRVTNIGFHDVDYHSNDGINSVTYSGTDWTASKVNDETSDGSPMSWATQTFAVNANANALRWGTLYNFRFDADVPPATGEATIDLFKTGTPASVVSALGSVPVPSAPVEPECPADWDDDTTVGVPDIFAFLASWFADDPAAQNFGGGSGVSAIFAFLSAWFAHGTGPC